MLTAKKGEKTKFIGFRVPLEWWIRVGVAARKQGITVQDFCLEALEPHVERAEKKFDPHFTHVPLRNLRKSSMEKV